MTRRTGAVAHGTVWLAAAALDHGRVAHPAAPVVMELRAGATSEPALLSVEQLTAGSPSLAVDGHLDVSAAAYRSARRRGSTVRGVLDCVVVVVVVAERHGVTLVHRDADLARMPSACRGSRRSISAEHGAPLSTGLP